MTELRPMLRSPIRRVEVASTAGGGAITADCEAGGGLRDAACRSGGGAMTDRSIFGARRDVCDAGITGAGPIGIFVSSALAIILGKGTS